MSLEIKIKDRIAKVEVVSQEGNLLNIRVDDITYQVDLMHTSEGVFSIIENGHSHEIEIVQHDQPKMFTGHTLYESYEMEIIDAESRYILNRGASGFGPNENTIVSPMPGKIVKILVAEGDTIKHDDTALIISAMKMESEYKSPKDGIVKKIFVAEGDTVESNQVLIEIE